MINGVDLKGLVYDSETSNKLIEKSFEAENHERELGKLGRFFGSGETVKMNIAGFSIVILLLIGIIYTLIILFCDTTNNNKVISIIDFWGIITPLITLAFGFIFGKTQK